MRKLLLAAIMLPNLAIAQVYFQGDSILVETPDTEPADIYTVQIQNTDDLTKAVTYTTTEATGTFYSPYCNVRVSRTRYYEGIAHNVTLGELKKVDINVLVAAMPNRKVQVTVTGGDYTIRFRHVSYGSWYTFYDGSMQYWPSGNFQQGAKQFYIPYRTQGQQAAIVTVHSQGCSQTVGRLFYLN